MATYTPQNISRDGLNPSLVAVAAADDFANSGRTFLFVDNASGGAVNCTFDLATDPHSSEPTQSSTQTNISVPAGEQRMIGPFPTNKFGSTVTVNYDTQASITAGAISL